MNKRTRLLLIAVSLALCVAAGLGVFLMERKVIKIPAEGAVEWRTERISDSDKLLLPAELIDLLPVAFRLNSSPFTDAYELLAEYGGKTYDRLPEDLNLLLADAGVEVTEENRWTVARAFVWAAHHELGLDSPLHFEEQYVVDEADVQVPGYRYQLALQARSQASGVVTRWKFGFEEGRIQVVLRTLIDVQEGEGAFAPLYVPDAERGLYSVWAGKYRGDSEYCVCCDVEGRLMWSGGSEFAFRDVIPLEFLRTYYSPSDRSYPLLSVKCLPWTIFLRR